VREIHVSIVMAMFQVAYLMVAPIVGANLQKIGRKNSILIGYTLTALATVGFGLIAYIP
jgi:MFS family permease